MHDDDACVICDHRWDDYRSEWEFEFTCGRKIYVGNYPSGFPRDSDLWDGCPFCTPGSPSHQELTIADMVTGLQGIVTDLAAP